MTSTFRDMFAVCVVALLCLMPLSHSIPQTCDELVKPLDQLDPHDLEGKWAMVASSLRITEGEGVFFPEVDSLTIDYQNSTMTKAISCDQRCQYFSQQNISIVGNSYHFTIGTNNCSGTFFHTSCADCVLLSFKTNSPYFKSEELCLFSKRRQVDLKEMSEFSAQVKCLKMPEHVVMDPMKELCPVPPDREN